MEMIAKWSRELLSVRMGQRLSPARARQVVLTNYVALASTAVAIPYVALFLSKGMFEVAGLASMLLVATFASLLLLHDGRPTFARHLLIAATNFFVFAFATAPRGSGTEALFLAVVANSVLIFRPEEWRHLLLAFGQAVLYFVLFRTTDVRVMPYDAWPGHLLEWQRMASDFVTLALLSATLGIFTFLSYRGEDRAKATKRQLAREIALVKLLQEVAALANRSDDYDTAMAAVARRVAERTGWSLGDAKDPLAAVASATNEPQFRADQGLLSMAFPVGTGTLVLVKAGVETPTSDLMATMRGVSHQLEALAMRLKAQEQNEEHRLGMMAASKMALIGEMYIGIAHEINNPLSVIQAHLARIERAIGTPEQDVKTRAAVADVHATIRRITRIISGLRGFARDSQHEQLEIVSLAAIVQDSVSMLEERIAKRGITLVVDTVPQDFQCECRPTQISQVLVNLLGNACDAVDGRTQRLVRIFVRDQGDRFVLTVADTGPGVPKELRQKIMQPFFTTKPEGKGTGLGLSISNDIVTRHGGWIEHEAVVDETHFRVYLPKRV